MFLAVQHEPLCFSPSSDLLLGRFRSRPRSRLTLKKMFEKRKIVRISPPHEKGPRWHPSLTHKMRDSRPRGVRVALYILHLIFVAKQCYRTWRRGMAEDIIRGSYYSSCPIDTESVEIRDIRGYRDTLYSLTFFFFFFVAKHVLYLIDCCVDINFLCRKYFVFSARRSDE